MFFAKPLQRSNLCASHRQRRWLTHGELSCRSSHLSFKLSRTDLTERRVSSPLVVEHLNVVEQRHLGVAAAGEVFPELVLHRGEPTLHDGIVIAVAPTAHAASDSMRLDDPLIVLARIRAPLVGVMQETRTGLAGVSGPSEELSSRDGDR